MSRSSPFRVGSKIPTMGYLCLPLFQLALSNLSCEDNEMCVNYDEQYPDGWSIWLLLLTVVVVLLCGVVLFCLQCWLKSCGTDRPRRTMAVFAVGDLDPVYGAEMAGSPTAGICLPTQNTELCPAPSLGALGPPPPYEEILKTN
ncbi:rCG36711 [Rattus norvegicus]|uniref:RCG36711 n=2 Tax=Rattus norvegicus TaxID=10116 RepID=A6JRY8_RAT|nr:transmembrane protein 207 [Rattus norvegicus]EDL78119.1 rCG36711 [Rattus norvegicus]|eukprot:XP_002727958.1 PREDICTED: transmembrane protein 207 isoform X2 [Rattus norvegicus]